jgi:hypothetical protein
MSIDLLVIQAIQLRWNSFYHLMVKLGSSLSNEIKKYVELSDEDRLKKLESEDKDENFDYSLKLILRNYKSDLDLWNFLKQQSKVLLNIKDWSLYRRVAESTKDIPKITETKKSAAVPGWPHAIRKELDILRSKCKDFMVEVRHAPRRHPNVEDLVYDMLYNVDKIMDQFDEQQYHIQTIRNREKDNNRLRVELEMLKNRIIEITNEIERSNAQYHYRLSEIRESAAYAQMILTGY